MFYRVSPVLFFVSKEAFPCGVTAGQVDPETSSRRERLAEVVSDYQALHVGLDIYASTTPDLNASQWSDLLLRSRFTISPGGHNPETFRTFEALEAG